MTNALQVPPSEKWGRAEGGVAYVWRLTWPVLPLIVIVLVTALDLRSPWNPVFDGRTGSLVAIKINGHPLQVGSESVAMGQWWVGEGTRSDFWARWSALATELDWTLRRIAGVLFVLGLALRARWQWDFKIPGIRRLPPCLVLSAALAICAVFVSGASSVYYLLYGEVIPVGDPSESRLLLYGKFSTWIHFYSLVIIAPIAEEILFRGWLQRLLTPICKVWPALLLQAAAFGAVHYPEQGPIGVFMTGSAGILLGLVYLYSGKLWPCILAHALINLFGQPGDLWWILNGRPE